MSFDFTSLDHVISMLEKKSLGPGSPPVMLNGHLVLWRTIRGFRTALELHPGDGRYKFGGKSYVGGRVLVGPPSLVNQDINHVDSKVWEALAGVGTKGNFSGNASPEGLSALKRSIKNSLKSDDTRQAALDSTDDTQKLVQIARSAGFTDGDIKASLEGKVFQNALGTDAHQSADNVIDMKTKKPVGVDTPGGHAVAEAGKAPEAPTVNKPVPPPTPETDNGGGSGSGLAMAAGGEDFTHALNALTIPGIVNADKKRKAADDLEKAAQGVSNELFRRQLEAYANGLRTGDFKLEDVRTSVKDLMEHRKSSLIAQLSPEDANRLHDKAIAKDTVREIREHVAEAENQAPSAKLDAANIAFYNGKLDKLEKALRDPKVTQQVKVLREQVKTQRLGGKSLILRLLQILRYILAFLPN